MSGVGIKNTAVLNTEPCKCNVNVNLYSASSQKAPLMRKIYIGDKSVQQLVCWAAPVV